jgi:hypothetical protein
MKVILDIKDGDRASFFMELLKGLDYIDVLKVINDPRKEKAIRELNESFKNVKLHIKGKKKLKSAKALLKAL